MNLSNLWVGATSLRVTNARFLKNDFGRSALLLRTLALGGLVRLYPLEVCIGRQAGRQLQGRGSLLRLPAEMKHAAYISRDKAVTAKPTRGNSPDTRSCGEAAAGHLMNAFA